MTCTPTARLLLVMVVLAAGRVQAAGPFRIHVVDEATGRGVPLVELTTTHQVTYVTDSAGMVAFDEPGLLGRRVHFLVRSHGYAYPKDGFGYAGVALDTAAGGEATVEVQRVNIAERLYRITGQGIYRDSVLLGDRPPLASPLLAGRVVGQDSVMVCPYRDRLYWFWGDTARPEYPLGNFAVSGATSRRPGRGGLDPEVGVDLVYFVDSTGFSRPMCPIEGPGPVWIDGLLTVRDDTGTEKLLAHFARMKNLGEVLERGLAAFDDGAERFAPILPLPLDAPLHPRGHPFRAADAGSDYFYFPAPFPNVRVRASWKDLQNPAAYEAFTCLAPGSRDGDRPELDRDASGRLAYGWKPDTAPLDPGRIRELMEKGVLRPEEAWPQLFDVETGEPVITHGGSLSYNAYRRRWIMIAQQVGGRTSLLGEVWFAEADTPLGPWGYARQIVTHDDYSFYNVTQHPFFDADGGRRIYFEGTYTAMFSGTKHGTPRYDYNQIMYGLSLDDRRLALPVPVYEVAGPQGDIELLTGEAVAAQHAWDRVRELAFFAIPPGRPREGHVSIVAQRRSAERTIGPAGEAGREPGPSSARLVVGETGASAGDDGQVVFLALPASAAPPSPAVVPLYEHIAPGTGVARYSTSADAPDPASPSRTLCHVWRRCPSPLVLAPKTVATPGP